MKQDTKTSVAQSPINWSYVAPVSFVAAIGGLLFGFDTGVVAGTISGVVRAFDLNAWQEGFAVSNLVVACIIGAVSTGPLTDRYGRKKLLIVAGLLFSLSAILSGVPQNYWQLIFARFIGGLGVGVASVLSPIYIAEIAPAGIRGVLVAVNQLAIVTGIMLTYCSNWLLVGISANDWRWMFVVEAVPAILFTVALKFIPESPRWLARRHRNDEAREVFRKVAGDAYAEKEMLAVRAALAHEEGGLCELLNRKLRSVLLVGCVLALLSNANGINVVIYYGTRIFEMAGFVERTASFKAQVFVGLANLIFTVVGMALVDRIGRKVLHVTAYGLMTLCMLVLGVMLRMKDHLAPIWMVIPVITYVASFSCGVGVVIWVYLSEMFPNKIRGSAMGIATMIVWTANLLTSQSFPVLQARMGGAVFYLFTAICFFGFLFSLVMMRETKGVALEGVDDLFLNSEP